MIMFRPGPDLLLIQFVSSVKDYVWKVLATQTIFKSQFMKNFHEYVGKYY